ncbi:MAG: butyrate kinase [Erysipelothrix sp.]|jgi:butyrate kinase|nr:butyrate kinase [Erysipelothrix sp.]
MKKILVTNLGSTSTKAAIYHDQHCAFETTLRHDSSDLSRFKTTLDQKDYRKESLETWLKTIDVSISDLDIICVRGGVLKPVVSGIYQVTDKVIEDILSGQYGMHVTNVGNLIGYEWGQTYNKEVIFVDAPISDELGPLARYSGHALVPRRSVFHALNQKQQARQYATSINVPYESLRLIVAHMGGGVSVGVHDHGRVVDVNNALDGEGAMSPERVGSLSSMDVLKLLDKFNGDVNAVKKQLVGLGGMMSYTNTSDVREVMALAQEDKKYFEIVEAMMYQVAKEIGAMATVLKGQVDQIILTGGLAYNESLMNMLKERVEFIAPITVYPGENELEALAFGALRYLNKEEACQVYE